MKSKRGRKSKEDKARERRQEIAAIREVELQKKVRRQMAATACDMRKFEKEISMKRVFKRIPRKNPKFQGYSKITYQQ